MRSITIDINRTEAHSALIQHEFTTQTGQYNVLIQNVLRLNTITSSYNTYLANLMQNCVKYLRDEARLSLMIGTLLFKCPMTAVT